MDAKRKWDDKHTDRLNQDEGMEVNERLANLSPYLQGGLAVDLACGLGANSLFLADHHYAVKAFDISEVAVNHVNRLALKEHATVHANVCDLSQWGNLDLKENSIDFLVTTYYLDRTIFPYVKSIIKEGGYFFMETFYLSRSHTNENVSNQYKLQPNELLTEFKDWHVLFYEENEQEGRQTIFAKKNVESR